MGEPSAEIDVIFVGQTGVGKSSLINMIMGTSAAAVTNDARPCTTQTTSYSASLEAGSPCRLWDTRGLDEAAGTSDRRFMVKIVDKIRQLASQQARELRETLRDRAREATTELVLLWCIDAAKIDVPVHWQQFHKVFVEYCERKATPAVVITRGPPKASDWHKKCTDQLRGLGLGEDIPIQMMRRYRSPASPEYRDDANALKAFILGLPKRG